MIGLAVVDGRGGPGYGCRLRRYEPDQPGVCRGWRPGRRRIGREGRSIPKRRLTWRQLAGDDAITLTWTNPVDPPGDVEQWEFRMKRSDDDSFPNWGDINANRDGPRADAISSPAVILRTVCRTISKFKGGTPTTLWWPDLGRFQRRLVLIRSGNFYYRRFGQQRRIKAH